MAATEQGALFQPEHTFAVGELAARVTRAVAAAFPSEVWVRGEIDGWRPPNASGHVYFSLCERRSRRGPTMTLPVALFRSERLRLERTLREWPDLRLADGLEVRVRGRVQYAYGRVQLVMSGLDPVHTLGRLAADRERVLRALAADGCLDAQRRLTLPAVPLHVALVTSVGSAAYEDVLHELEASGFGFRVSVADARVQGTGAETSILRALTAAAGLRPDVVLLARGGGARTDLATFDSERVARAIAGLRVPVVTGIGHEIDTSVADEVAHLAWKTPTAAAAGLADLVRAAMARAEAAWAAVAACGTRAPSAADAHLADRSERLVARAVGGLGRAASRVDARAGRVATSARLDLAAAGARLDEAHRRVAPARLDARLGRLLADNEMRVRRLRRAADRSTAAAAGRLDVLAARTDAADPARALARGWTMTRTADGRLVRRAAELQPGDELVTSFSDGRAGSRVTAVTVADHDPDPDPEQR